MNGRRLAHASCALCVVALACDEGAIAPQTTDGGADAGWRPDEPIAPTPPALPDLGPCAPGWVETPATPTADVTVCRPWAEAIECTGARAQFPGTSTCELPGDPCGSGEFAPAPAGEVLYVREGATSGDGTIERPFATIAEAAAIAPAGATILVGAGTYAGPIRIFRSVTIAGLCAERTRIDAGPFGQALATIGGDTIVRNLRIETAGGLVGAAAGGTLALDGVAIVGLARVMVEGVGAVTIERSLLASTASPADSTTGLVAQGPVTVRRSVFRGFTRSALELYDGAASLTLEDSIVTARTAGARGVDLRGPAVAVVERTLFHTPGDVGLAAFGATVDARDVVVEGAPEGLDAPRASPAFYASSGAVMTLDRSVALAPLGGGFYAIDAGTRLVARDVIVVEPGSFDRDGSFGIEAGDDATIEVERVLVHGADRVGIAVEYGHATVTDATVRLTSARLDDAAVPDTLPVDSGIAVAMMRGGTLIGSRIDIEGGRGIGLVVALGATATIDDLRVAGTLAFPIERTYGYGVTVFGGARATLDRVLLEDNGVAALYAFNEDTEVTVRNARATGTRSAPCGMVPAECGGLGVSVTDGARLAMERFALEDNALAGVLVAFGDDVDGRHNTLAGTVDLVNGRIARNALGVSVYDESYDLARLTNRVEFAGNGRNVDVNASSVPTPSSFTF